MKDPIVEQVRQDLLSRSQVGIEKYGVTLARTDFDTEDWARMMYEELLDGALYCKRLMEDLKRLKECQSQK